MNTHFSKYSLHLSARRARKDKRGDVTLGVGSGPSPRWLPWWAMSLSASGPRDNLAVILSLEEKGGFDCTIYRYPGMNIEGGTVAFLTKRIIKYQIWENLAFVEQNGMKS